MKKQYTAPKVRTIPTLIPTLLAGSTPQQTIRFNDECFATEDDEIL